MEQDILQVPAEYVGERVNIFLDHVIGVPAGDGKGQVPMFIAIVQCTFKGQNASTIQFVTHDESIFGPAGEKTLPKRKVAGIGRCTGGIDLAKTMPRISLS